MPITATGQLMEELISPRECCLAVALPLTQDEFMCDFAASPRAGYAAAFVGSGREGLPALTLWELFEPWARLANQVIGEVSACGVAIVRRATLDDLSSLLQRFRATTLFAHWHTPEFKDENIINPESLLQALHSNDSLLSRRIHELNSFRRSPLQLPVDPSQRAIADFLNQLTEPPPCNLGTKPGCMTQKQVEWHEKRMLLELALPGGFRGGAGVDFADGWRSIDSIVAAVPAGYSGTLDLTICNSNVLAERIRLKFPKCVAMANEDSTTTGFRFAAYAEIIQSLSRNPGIYEEVALKLRDQLFPVKHMKKLAPLLAKYSAPPSQGTGKQSELNRSELISELRIVRSSNTVYFLICVVMLIALFVAGCVLALTLFTKPTEMKTTFGAMGFSMMGVFYQMTRLWKEKVLTDTLIVLAGALPPSQIKQIMEIILRKLKLK